MARDHFYRLTEYGTSLLRGKEVLLANFVGEVTDFVRFNQAKVRQAMTIRQGHLSLSLIDDGRRDTTTVSLSGDSSEDRAQVAAAIADMRATLPALPADPFLLYSTEVTSSDRVELGELPPAEEALNTVLRAAAGTDFVGLSSCGPMQRGFASSLGHRHWHEVGSFSLDFSLYHSTDKAVSRAFSTAKWDARELEASLASAREALQYLARPPKTITPGDYRAYLSPAAVAELVSMLNWGGVSAKAQRTKTSCIQKLSDGELGMSEKFSLSEASESGLAPAFDDVGFQKPARVALIDRGRHAGALTGPRTAKEYGVAANTDAEESLHSAEVAAGSLAMADALGALDRGVFIGNLWYLNFSDRFHARITGMTRFATFWVEDGQIQAPLNVMRFDDSLFRLLGDKLLELTRERDWVLSSSSYGQRSVETSRLPGALIRDMTFTL